MVLCRISQALVKKRKFQNRKYRTVFYYDLNNNGQYDSTIDLPASDLKTKINNTLFITPKNGNIKYRKVPYGTYMIKALEDKWYVDDLRINVDRKDVFLTIPLQKQAW